ncbi:hypothetical protein Tco_0927799 [Tanacetum coccineum]
MTASCSLELGDDYSINIPRESMAYKRRYKLQDSIYLKETSRRISAGSVSLNRLHIFNAVKRISYSPFKGKSYLEESIIQVVVNSWTRLSHGNARNRQSGYSTTEAEYVAACKLTVDKGLAEDSGFSYEVPTSAAKTLSRVASQKPKSIDKGRRYKRSKETTGKKVVTSLDFQEEVSTGYAEGVNTGSIKVSIVSEQVSTVSGQVSTDSIKKSIPSPNKGQREGKAPMIIEEAPKKTKEQLLQEEASLAEAIKQRLQKD